MARPSVPDPAEIFGLAHRAGVDVVALAPAHPFEESRRVLEERKAQGLHAGMQFTYRNPSRSTDPARLVPGARSLVVGARSYRRRAEKDDQDGRAGSGDRPSARSAYTGRVARYSWEDHYLPLRAGLAAVAGLLEESGWTARVVVDDNALVDRAAAYRAGMGWFGRNSMLLLPGQGSWFVLGSVVTDAPLDVAGPEPAADGCGSCRRCVSACPTGAIVADGVVDARRCLAWLLEAPGSFPREYRSALGDRIYGCDECQEVCPPNRLESRRHPAPPPGTGAQPEVDLLDLLGASDEEILDRHGRWYIAGRQARFVRRNALVALGNVGDGADERVERAIRRALGDPDPLIRAHAAWAAGRLGLVQLLRAARGSEDDPDVVEEMEGALGSVGAASP